MYNSIILKMYINSIYKYDKCRFKSDFFISSLLLKYDILLHFKQQRYITHLIIITSETGLVEIDEPSQRTNKTLTKRV